jgi:hypothetical protein
MALSLAAAIPVLVVTEAGNASGHYLFCSLNAFFYSICFIVIVVESCWSEIGRKQIRGGKIATAC